MNFYLWFWNIFIEEISEWRVSVSNGGAVTMTLTNQNIEGHFVVDSSSSLSI